jgi:hypothetical protein
MDCAVPISASRKQSLHFPVFCGGALAESRLALLQYKLGTTPQGFNKEYPVAELKAGDKGIA